MEILRDYKENYKLVSNSVHFRKELTSNVFCEPQVWKMDDYFHILQKLLKLMGLDIFAKQRKKWHLIVRLIFFGLSLFLILALCFSSFDSQNDFVDRLLKYLYMQGNIILVVQIFVFLKNKSKILDLSIWLKESYTGRNLIIVQRYAKESLMQRYKTISVNLLRMTLSSGFIMAITNCAIPFIIPDSYIYPVDTTFTNSQTIDAYLNFGLHAYMFLLNSAFLTVKSCLFISFTINLLFKLKMISEICTTVGETEERHFTELCKIGNNGENVQRDKVLRNVLTTMTLKAFQTSKSSSAAKLKLIIDLHSEVINNFGKLVHVEEINLLTSEILLLSASVGFITLLLSDDLTRSTPLLFLSLVLYVQMFFVCLAGSLIQVGFEAVGSSLYNSKWYWLMPANRKILLTIMITANKARKLSVGKCKSANLERFTLLSKMLYQIYFIVQVFVE